MSYAMHSADLGVLTNYITRYLQWQKQFISGQRKKIIYQRHDNNNDSRAINTVHQSGKLFLGISALSQCLTVLPIYQNRLLTH